MSAEEAKEIQGYGHPTRSMRVDETIMNSIEFTTQKIRNGRIDGVNTVMKEGVTIRIAIRRITASYTKKGVTKSKLSKDKPTIKITNSGKGNHWSVQDLQDQREREPSKHERGRDITFSKIHAGVHCDPNLRYDGKWRTRQQLQQYPKCGGNGPSVTKPEDYI